MDISSTLSEGNLVIYLFHGVIKKQDSQIRNYKRKHLEEAYFEKIIEFLKKNGKPLSMDDVVDHYNENEPFSQKSFVITFDDGFENNYSVALPILKKYKIPATFYITSDFVDQNHMSWIDRIEYCIDHTATGNIRLPWSDQIFSFKNTVEKIELLDEIRNNAKVDPSINFESLVKSIFTQCQQDQLSESFDPLDLKLNWNQVIEMNEYEDFIIGGHSHTHQILSFLDKEALSYEIKKSIDLIKNKTHISINHYSYPEGLSHCYSDEVILILKENGISCCPTAENGVNTHNTDLFRLKRIMVT